MKRLFTLVAIVAITIGTVVAQAPNLINYQAVARDGSGNIMANQAVNVGFKIHSGSAGGTIVFEETHNGTTTNDFGLFSLQVGGGTNVSGSIGGIGWGSDSYWLEVEVNGASISTQQLVSVPYALEAGAPWTRAGDNITYSDGNIIVANGNDMAGAPGQVDASLAQGEVRAIFGSGTGQMTGLAFTVSSNYNTSGGAIAFERTGGESQGKLHFATKGSTTAEHNIPIRMTISENGNVGIGTTTPAVKLQVDGGSDVSLAGGGYIITNTITGTNIGIDDNEIMARNNGATATLFLNNDGGNVIIGATTTDRVGVGTNNPQVNIHMMHSTGGPSVGDGLTLENVGANGNYWSHYVQNGNADYYLYFKNVYKGSFDDATGAYSSVSDARMKREIEPTGLLLEKVKQLQIMRYKMIGDETDRECMGALAQQVEPLFPEMVYHNFDDDGSEHYSMDYSMFGVIAIKAIQEQQTQMEAMQAQIEALKKEIEDLKK